MVSDKEVLDNLAKFKHKRIWLEKMKAVSDVILAENTIKQAHDKMKDLIRVRDALSESISREVKFWSDIAHNLGVEIGKLHKLRPDEMSSRILMDGTIIISAGKDESFKMEFKTINEQLVYLVRMARLVGLENGVSVSAGKKTQSEVYNEIAGW